MFVGETGEEEDERVVRVEAGKAIIFRGGEVSHGGKQIAAGTRYISLSLSPSLPPPFLCIR